VTVKPYDEYKTSDSRFLRKIPVHWDESPLKWHIQRNDGGAWGEDPRGGEHDVVVLRSTEQTVDGTWCIEEPAKRSLSESEREATLLTEGDLLITKSSGSSLHIGKTTLVTSDVAGLGCCYSNFMQRLRLGSSLEPKLGWYLLNNKLSRDQLNLLSSSTTGLANINATTIGRIYVPVPPKGEQVSILRFLDRETAKIDALIAEQQRLIELLQEKRQAVISHAVTKGLNPNAPMKDSGVEWLGEVPEHWMVASLRRYIRIAEGQVDPRLEPYSTMTLIAPNHIESGTGLLTSLETAGEQGAESGKYLCDLGDVIYSKIRPALRKACIAPEACLTSADMYPLKAMAGMSNEFLLNFLLSPQFSALAIVESERVAMPKINRDALLAVSVAVPPLSEQHEICSHIKQLTIHIDQLTVQASSSIRVMNERRSALISAAVTGQIDVRGLAEAEAVEQ
jgi:type I restriction enzyme, S subunit